MCEREKERKRRGSVCVSINMKDQEVCVFFYLVGFNGSDFFDSIYIIEEYAAILL